MSCTHNYDRQCLISAPCCGVFYPCRFCHDDDQTHQINRFKINRLKCKMCNFEQEVSNDCEECGTQFGKYFCSICKFFDNNLEKKIYHCPGCGLCRVGGQENFFHCYKCNLCIDMKNKEDHKCLEGASDNNCPICMEDLHSSTKQLALLNCRHIFHYSCYEACLKSGHFACPICNVSSVDMASTWKLLDEEIANTPMPEEYQNINKFVLCRDCHKTTETLFHVIGMKCMNCGSYNTTETDPPTDSQQTIETPGQENVQTLGQENVETLSQENVQTPGQEIVETPGQEPLNFHSAAAAPAAVYAEGSGGVHCETPTEVHNERLIGVHPEGSSPPKDQSETPAEDD